MKDKGKTYGHVVKGTNWDLDDEVLPKVLKQPRKKATPYTPNSRTPYTPNSRTKGTKPGGFKIYNE
jgi:hypothetical protein